MRSPTSCAEAFRIVVELAMGSRSRPLVCRRAGWASRGRDNVSAAQNCSPRAPTAAALFRSGFGSALARRLDRGAEP